MSEHLDLDALADVLAGEARPDHLADCAVCRTALAELEAALGPVDAALAALPAPEVPAQLVARLDAAVARERRAASAVPAATVTPLAGRLPRRSRWLPGAGAVAAAAALVVGGVFVAQQLGGGTGPTAGQDASALRAKDSFATSSTGNDYTRDGVQLRQALPRLLRGDAPAAPASTRSLGGRGAAPAGPMSALETLDPLARLREPAPLASCLAALSEPGDPGLPLALDYARFAAQPALVVVLPSSQPDQVDVFVVAADCSQADARLLFFSRLDKP
jgi:hypothetical protein